MKQSLQTAFSCSSFLLSYPEFGWREALTELQEEIAAIEQEDVKASLTTFIKQALHKTNDQLIDSYVYTFDFGKKTNMYLTYMNTGEQRERGIELLELKQHYKKSGFEVTDKELPDYLPLLLEFFTHANEQDSEPIMSKYKENIQTLHVQLKEADSMYEPILAAVLLAIEAWGVQTN
ncbi:TPA: nitrate reductase molybdenum cofactor assembly chaperone [Bacillus pacificus]|uniref:nitrate reductase molybdenum cofactor assembly chaperone n=1 Tax=Bacillus pacificus TaxID=2026187 RepID=UPI00027CD612|nr:nitrate reductase molybdenum cofactor assembly chaperone [Bacillus pacificus]AFQ12672.1 nitrate reductase molybdenum cofactor assembly chaperone [Bacillus cereus FRI-35]MCU5067692.1 nitrate reductase molybdenum cofactor assembly chaperone [Bacillus pacificus]HDR7742775.1 nitrate reductase molybdenum cofactor assembly chaperone [Bacillus pacificus]